MRSSTRARIALAGVALAALAATGARAASLLDFDVWMRAIDRHSVQVQRNIDAHRAQAAIADAQELVRLYGLMEAFFAAGHATDALEMSRSGKSFADAIPAALAAGDYDGAAKAALDLSQACNDCHDAHKPFQ